MTLRVFSYGGGWQSNAALVLAAQGQLDYRTFLFCNVGDDSENPATLAYVRDHAVPYAAAHGLELHELHRVRRDGTSETLFGRLTRPGSRSLPIPVRMANGAPGTRQCTADFKIKVVANWVKAAGATVADPAVVGIGFSLDEIGRIGDAPAPRCTTRDYPLLDLRVRRSDIPAIMDSAGLPMPPKSACWFCPMHRESAWLDMRRDQPRLFTAAAGLEDILNQRRRELGKDRVFFTRFGRPLRDVITDGQETLFDGDGACDSGWCFT